MPYGSGKDFHLFKAGDAGESYVDRGDDAGVHFTTGAFTTDGNWHDLSLAAYVPAGVRVVHILLNIRDDLTNQAVELRENGNANAFNEYFNRTQVANISICDDILISCDENRVIEYMFTNTTWTYIALQVRGWFV